MTLNLEQPMPERQDNNRPIRSATMATEAAGRPGVAYRRGRSSARGQVHRFDVEGTEAGAFEKKPNARAVHILPYGVMWQRTGLWDQLSHGKCARGSQEPLCVVQS